MNDPLKVGSVTLSPETDFFRLVRETLEGGGLSTTHQGDAPFAVEALYRVEGLLEGTSYLAPMARGVAGCLTHPDPLVRGQALHFFAEPSRAAREGGEHIEDLVENRRELFAGVADPVAWGADMELSLLGALGARVRTGSARALDLAQRIVVEPGKAAPMLVAHLAGQAPDWVRRHAEEIVRGTPAAGATLLATLGGADDLVARLAPLAAGDPGFREEARRRAPPIPAPKPPVKAPAREPPRPIRTEAVEAIAERLRQRGAPAAHALVGLDCAACGVLGLSYSDEDPDSARSAAATSLARFARPERGWSLLECPRCGALFRQTATGPPAADSLFERTVHLERVSADGAIALLPSESAHRTEERTIAQMLALLLARACFLSNFSRVQQSREGEERFIFVDEGVVLDAWHVQATDAVGQVSWSTIEEFKEVVPQLFPFDSVDARYVHPFEQVPEVVQREAPRRYLRIQELEGALKEEGKWVPLRTHAETRVPRRTGPRRRKKHSLRKELSKPVVGPTTMSYLYRGPILGWQYVSCQAGRVTSVKVDSQASAEGRLEEVVRSNMAAAAEPLPPAMLSRLRQIESTAVEALARLEAGEACAHPLGVMTMVRGRFVVADVVGELVKNLVELDRTRALDHLVSGLVRRKPAAFVPLSAAERDRLSTLLDPDARWELFVAGRLVVGGGPTTDSQWTLSCEKGRYRYEGTRSEWLPEERAMRIVREKQYAWLQVG